MVLSSRALPSASLFLEVPYKLSVRFSFENNGLKDGPGEGRLEEGSQL